MVKRPRKPTSQPLLKENVPLQSRPIRKSDPKQPHLRAWTRTGTLRQTSFKGMREEADAANILRLAD